MYYLKAMGLIFFIITLSLTSCLPAPAPQKKEPVTTTEPKDREVRDRFISDFDDRLGGDPCKDEDIDAQCREDCDEIYRNNRYVEDCIGEYSPAQIEELFVIHETITDPDDRNLSRIKSDALTAYMEISPRPFEKAVRDGDFKDSDAETVLLWIIDNDDIAESILNEDSDFTILEELLYRVDDDNIVEALTESIDRTQSVIELSAQAGNSYTLQWFIDYLFETEADCKDKESLACFKLVCQIGDDTEERERVDWLDSSEFFQDYIDEIIDEQVNACYCTESDWRGTPEAGDACSGRDDTADKCMPTNTNPQETKRWDVGGRNVRDGHESLREDFVQELCRDLDRP